MTTVFSTSGEDAMARIIHVQQDPSDNSDFEIQRTANEIIKGDYKRIALQFPDELLHISVPIYRQLKSQLGDGRELYVLADTSYGSCCVDEVAAQHVDADAMVHYGRACMSLTSRLPVIYVFGKKTIDVDLCVKQLVEAFYADGNDIQRSAILLKHDVVFTHQADEILEKLRQYLDPRSIPILYHKIPTTTTPTVTNNLSKSLTQLKSNSPAPNTDAAQPSSEIPLTHNTIFYIGSESVGLTNLLMTNASSKIFSFNPSSEAVRLESSRTNKLLMRRYGMVQKARDADVFGILVGTLGVASYLPLITHLRKLLTQKQKKSYTISVGKLSPAKLANFLEVECFVYVACPEGAIVVGDKEFLKPIVTPYELEIALGVGRGWTGEYVLDFEKILSESKGQPDEVDERHGSDEHDNDNEAEGDDGPVFSLVTGTYRHPKRYGGGEHQQPQIDGRSSDAQSAVILRNKDTTVAQLDSAAGQFLLQRTYQGLDARTGEDAPSVLEQGRIGVARGYQDDIDRLN